MKVSERAAAFNAINKTSILLLSKCRSHLLIFQFFVTENGLDKNKDVS